MSVDKARHAVVLHYSEIGLKGKNRRLFEERLVKNLRLALRGLGHWRIERAYGRFVMHLPDPADWAPISARLRKVVGLANFALAETVPQSPEAIIEAACRQMARRQFASFAVYTRRVQKEFPLTSMELSSEAGRRIQEQSGARVDLDHADVTCFIEIFDRQAIVYTEKIPGLRGLPIGTGERALGLLSSGIDSPVACWKVMRRGVKMNFVHFHSMPYTSEASLNNTRRLVELLTPYQFTSKLYSVPFIEIQQQVMATARPEYGVVLYRRSMIRIAEKIARKLRANALVTGESIGQVASQTLSNIRAIADPATLPILRPLVGSAKEEIIAVAREIGSYEISTEPYEDCCSLFIPKHPVTRALPEIILDAEMKLDLEKLERQALEAAQVEQFRFP